jgi:hypothetical protein
MAGRRIYAHLFVVFSPSERITPGNRINNEL